MPSYLDPAYLQPEKGLERPFYGAAMAVVVVSGLPHFWLGKAEGAPVASKLNSRL
jgi:hypothetical protein